jgi:large subunit ribosomal protein L32
MPHEPKRRHSVGRKGKRRASIKLAKSSAVACPNCGQPTVPHTVCKFCGFYKGVEVVKKESKAKVTKTSV